MRRRSYIVEREKKVYPQPSYIVDGATAIIDCSCNRRQGGGTRVGAAASAGFQQFGEVVVSADMLLIAIIQGLSCLELPTPKDKYFKLLQLH